MTSYWCSILLWSTGWAKKVVHFSTHHISAEQFKLKDAVFTKRFHTGAIALSVHISRIVVENVRSCHKFLPHDTAIARHMRSSLVLSSVCVSVV